MANQIRNDQMVNLLSADYRKLYDATHSWGDAISMYLSLPQLRGFWPMSSVNESGNVYDLSGQGRTLTNNGAATFGTAGLVPYASTTSGKFFSRADEAGLDITGGLTIVSWRRFTTLPGATQAFTLTKDQAYRLYHLSNYPIFAVYDAVPTIKVLQFDPANVSSANTWYFLAARFTPSTEMKLWRNEEFVSTTSSVPATLNNSANQLSVGLMSAGAADNTLVALCATALSDAQIFTLYEGTRALFNV